jgi:hypothetical protein
MEVVSTVDSYPAAGTSNFQYSIPLEDSALVAIRDRRAEAREANKQRRQAATAHHVAPFNNWMYITPKDIQVIHGIINYLDSKGTLALAFPANQKFLKEEGKKIDHVHPLCFIWAIVSVPEMRDRLRNFRDNSAFALKWDGFLGYSSFHDKGFGRNMERYYNHRDFHECLEEFEAFYRSLSLRPEIMNQYVASKQWAQFASALLESGSYF